MNYLHAVVFRESCSRPVGTAHYFAIALNGQPVGRKHELTYQGFQSYPFGQLSLFTVHSYAQSYSSSALLYDAAQLRLVAVGNRPHQYGRTSGLEVR